jgi:5-methylthioadenosine/S-adenosylhomocysteine deaminase
MHPIADGVGNSRLLITGGEILAGPGRRPERADVLLKGGRIERVGADLSVAASTRRLDAEDMIVIPGLINAHTHGHNNLARGLAARWTLEQLISFGPAIQANRTAEDHYLSAALGAIEMLKTGVTAAYDLYMAVPSLTRMCSSPCSPPTAISGCEWC